MSTVLAAVDLDDCALAVIRTARALAALLGHTAVGLQVREDGGDTLSELARAEGVQLHDVGGSAVDEIVTAARDPSVAGIVLGMRASSGGREPAGRTALEVIARVVKPVVLVSPDAQPTPAIARVLVPLEGTSESMQALGHVLDLDPESELEILALHLHSPATVPAFSDHDPYESQAWERQFLSQGGATSDSRIKFLRRVGAPAEQITTVAHETSAELIAIAWSQDLSPGHAHVLTETLARSDVPVLLLPSAPGKRRAP